jgi:hypothetical protein
MKPIPLSYEELEKRYFFQENLREKNNCLKNDFDHEFFKGKPEHLFQSSQRV